MTIVSFINKLLFYKHPPVSVQAEGKTGKKLRVHIKLGTVGCDPPARRGLFISPPGSYWNGWEMHK